MKSRIYTTLLTWLIVSAPALAQITISWPIDKTVYQRSGTSISGGNATFTVGGQCVLTNTEYQLQMRILNLNVQSGATN